LSYQYAFGLSLALQTAALVWFAIPWVGTLGEYLSRSFTRPTAAYDSRAGLVRVPDEGPVLEVHGQMEW
jgi:hypothetical protein